MKDPDTKLKEPKKKVNPIGFRPNKERRSTLYILAAVENRPVANLVDTLVGEALRARGLES